MTDYREYMAYLSHRECGASATTMLYKFNGIGGVAINHPHDPDDFSRCLKLLERFPEFRPMLPTMKGLSPEWTLLIDHWDELEAMFKRREFNLMYDKMRGLFDSISCDLCGEALHRSWTGEHGKRYHAGCYEKLKGDK